MSKLVFGAAVGAVLTLASTASLAGELGSFEAWSAQSFKVGGKLACSMWSQPQSAEGKYKQRGEIFVWVSHRPADKTRDRLSLEMGYPIKGQSIVTVRIDENSYTLPTHESTAWSGDSKVDRAMVKAIRAGREMEVKGTSRRGTLTRDVYSLKGFTAAHKAITKACGL